MRFRNLLSELSGERLVILSTHIVSDVESIATEIAIMKGGALVALDTPDALIRSAGAKSLEDAYLAITKRGAADAQPASAVA